LRAEALRPDRRSLALTEELRENEAFLVAWPHREGPLAVADRSGWCFSTADHSWEAAMVSRARSVVLVAAALLSLAAPSVAAPARDSFVVVLQPGTANVPAVAAALAHQAGGRVGFVYEHALKGFSLSAAPAAAKGLAKNPTVAYVEADRLWSIEAQTVPTGISRTFAVGNSGIDIDATDDSRVDVDVAVIDTGIDLDHPDLNVLGGVTCTSRWPWGSATCSPGGDDDHYHGTHVAGTIAALDNGIGVVGMAPGARLHAVKVLNSQGSGYTSWIVAGINYVAANAATIEVANMSLGGSGFSQSQYDAIQGAVNKGVAFAVAAGNSDADANNYSPGGFDNVLSVSALADFNGRPGGGAASTCRSDVDDTLADFSNWGSAVDIAAPGVCILSTYPVGKGEYGTISGTSMASPHAAGALALLASRTNPASEIDVGTLYTQVKNAGNVDWTDDSGDNIKEPLLDVSNASLFAPVLIPGSGGGGEPPANQPPVASFTYQCSSLTCSFTSTSTDTDGLLTSHSWTFGDGASSTETRPNHTYNAGGTYTVVLTVTDDDQAAATASQSVTVSSPSAVTLSGSASSQGNTWTATVTLTGPAGAATTGTWSNGGTGTCEIPNGSASCSFTKPGIAKKTSSVTYTDSGTLGSVTIIKP
jgi:subtilisin family serine protease